MRNKPGAAFMFVVAAALVLLAWASLDAEHWILPATWLALAVGFVGLGIWLLRMR